MLIERLAGRRILVIGDVMLDHFVSGETHRVSPEAPALVLHATADRSMPGGAANVALNIASLGGQPLVVGVIGCDAAGDKLEALARCLGLQAALIRDERACTIQKTRYLAGDRHLLRVDRESIGVSAEASRKVVAEVEARIDDCECVIVSDYAKGVITPEVFSRLLAAARARGIPVLADPKHPDFSLYQGATVLTPNRAELSRATATPCDSPDSQLEAALTAMRLTGAAMLLTMGEHGMALYDGHAEIWREAARAHGVRDVSGAGDTVIAAFGLALAAGADLKDAARLANAAAGVVVGRSGLSQVTPAELAQALARGPKDEPPPGKIARYQDVAAIREHWRSQGLMVGLTNGCFDILHPGHLKVLETAKDACDRLIVALNSDASVRRLKGDGRPVQGEGARAALIGALRHVDLVVVFDEDTPLELIEAVRPDLLVKGGDYAASEVVGAEVVASYGGKVVLAPLADGHSTSELIRRAGPSRTRTPGPSGVKGG
jgi:D-beta-D-heptose 7-phosphate kinase/D-beta-D-heptose 1-phosphate adenosyltransferase